MAALPYMQFYVSEYLADTSHFTTEEHGAYLLLMFRYWQTGGPLPADDKLLARFSGLPLDRWMDVKQVLEQVFNTCSTEWRHARIDHDLDEVERLVTAKSAAGKKSAAARKRNAIKARKQRASNTCSTGVQQVSNKEEEEEEVISSKELINTADEILDFLNESAGKNYRKNDTNRKLVTSRLSDKYTPDDCKAVIRKKVAEWRGTEQEKYIRPETLFNKTKFEGYLNAPEATHAANRPGGGPATNGRNQTPAERVRAKREEARRRNATGPSSDLGVVGAYE